MHKIISFYLSSKLTFYIINILLAVFFPVLLVIQFSTCTTQEIIIEGALALPFVFIIGGYEDMKKAYKSFTDQKVEGGIK